MKMKNQRTKKLFLKDTHEWVATIYNFDEFSFNEEIIEVEEE